MCGDFNYPNIHWPFLTCNTSYSQMFLDAVHDDCFFQHITKPTRYRANTTASTLDLMFTKEEGMVDSIEYLPAIASSDHVCLQFNLLCYSSYSQLSRTKYNLY